MFLFIWVVSALATLQLFKEDLACKMRSILKKELLSRIRGVLANLPVLVSFTIHLGLRQLLTRCLQYDPHGNTRGLCFQDWSATIRSAHELEAPEIVYAVLQGSASLVLLLSFDTSNRNRKSLPKFELLEIVIISLGSGSAGVCGWFSAPNYYLTGLAQHLKSIYSVPLCLNFDLNFSDLILRLLELLCSVSGLHWPCARGCFH